MATILATLLAALAVGADSNPQAPPSGRVIEFQMGRVRVVSDRAETFPEFCRRQRVMVGRPVPAAEASGVSAASADGSVLTVRSPARNDAPGLAPADGSFRVAPVSAEVAELVRTQKAGLSGLSLVLVGDAEGRSWRVVGVASLASSGFFNSEGRDISDFDRDQLHFKAKE